MELIRVASSRVEPMSRVWSGTAACVAPVVVAVIVAACSLFIVTASAHTHTHTHTNKLCLSSPANICLFIDRF